MVSRIKLRRGRTDGRDDCRNPKGFARQTLSRRQSFRIIGVLQPRQDHHDSKPFSYDPRRKRGSGLWIADSSSNVVGADCNLFQQIRVQARSFCLDNGVQDETFQCIKLPSFAHLCSGTERCTQTSRRHLLCLVGRWAMGYSVSRHPGPALNRNEVWKKPNTRREACEEDEGRDTDEQQS
jgi:hypothetical protein